MPARSREGELYITRGRSLTSLEILPPSREGWQEFVALASASDYDRDALENMARRWWDRSLRERKADTGSAALATLTGKRDAARRATSALLRHRGFTVSAGEGLQGELVLLLGSQRFRLPAGALLSRPELRTTMPPLEAAAREAVGDVLTLVDQMRPELGERAFAWVAERLETAPEQFDDAFALEDAPFEASDDASAADPSASPEHVEAILDEILGALDQYAVEVLEREAGERRALLKSKNDWDVFAGVPQGTSLANLTLVFRRGLAAEDFDFSPLRATWAELRRSRAQYRSITERVMRSVASQVSQIRRMDEGALFRRRVQREGRFRVTSTYHRKEKRNVWMVSVVTRVPEDEFSRLRALASKHRGFYSTYKTSTTPTGFQFTLETDAWAFVKDATRRVHDTPQQPAQPDSASSTSAAAGESGNHWIVGARVYGDTALVKALTARYPFERPHSDLVSIRLPYIVLMLRHTRDDAILPSQQGPLYEVTGQGDVQAALSRLWREGISEFRGSFSDWPVAKG